MGATGNTGRPIVEELLKRGGVEVVAMGRDREKLAALELLGALPAVGDLQDTAFLTQTLQGAHGVYAMIPPAMIPGDFGQYQDAVGQSIATAIENAGVRKVVHLSSQGADLPAKNGPVAGLYRQEARLNLISGIHVVHLRPTYFLDNLFMFLPQLPNGTIYSHLKPEATLPMIATADIAAVAAGYLGDLNFQGRTIHDLLGAAEYTYADVLEAFRKHFSAPHLQWAVIPDAAQLEAMKGFGLSESLAGMYVELGASINEGLFANTPVRTASNTTPTTLDSYVAQVMAPAAQAGSAH